MTFIGRSKGGAMCTCSPNGIQFFRFCIRFHHKVLGLEVGAPPMAWCPPPMENPGSTTDLDHEMTLTLMTTPVPQAGHSKQVWCPTVQEVNFTKVTLTLNQ